MRSRRHRPGRWTACLALLAAGLAACSSGTDKTTGASTTSTTASGPAATAPTSTTAAPGASTPPDAPSGPEGGPVPAGFAAASVTFVSLRTGWVLGTAPCATPPCTSLVRTRDGGRTWVGIPAPAAELSGDDRSTGIRQIRFADTDDGWAFGPDLWTTHDGGAHWSPTTLPGGSADAAVSDLGAAGGSVHVAVLDPHSGGVRILTSPVDHDAWQASPTTVPIGAGPVPFAQVVLQAGAGWLIEVDRIVGGGARLSGASWAPWAPPCADAGGAAFLAASTPKDLVAVCDEGEWNDRPRAVRTYVSGDGGTTFAQTAPPVPLTNASAIASGRPGAEVVAGTTAGALTPVLVATFDGGTTWSTVHTGGGARSWVDLGFTSPDQGVAVEVAASPGSGALLMTLDAGHTWDVVPIA